MKDLVRVELASMIDLSCVQAGHDYADIDDMANFAREEGIFAVFALPAHTERLKALIAGSPVKLGGTVGFPSGSTTTQIKVVEVEQL
ncbi:MAG: hypothetical protein Q8M76_10375, partial [Spirochaetaceae bacterium]|nr:hypothetical protein [Spirochaetaceae bacterium]